MINDEYIVARLYEPIIMTILLMVMTYFHRKHVLKYLYITNIFCYIVYLISYFTLVNHPVGEPFSRQWMNVLPFTWVGGIFAGYFLFVASVIAFVVEHSKRYKWAKIMIVIARGIFIVLCIIGMYLFMQGIRSLKSG